MAIFSKHLFVLKPTATVLAAVLLILSLASKALVNAAVASSLPGNHLKLTSELSPTQSPVFAETPYPTTDNTIKPNRLDDLTFPPTSLPTSPPTKEHYYYYQPSFAPTAAPSAMPSAEPSAMPSRSEERRVGKECW